MSKSCQFPKNPYIDRETSVTHLSVRLYLHGALVIIIEFYAAKKANRLMA